MGREREKGEKKEGKRMTWRVKEGEMSLRLKRWRGWGRRRSRRPGGGGRFTLMVMCLGGDAPCSTLDLVTRP